MLSQMSRLEQVNRRPKRTTRTHENGFQPTRHEKSKCAICRDHKAFAVPDHLMDQLSASNVVLFAGAGVSTESRLVFPTSFYEDVHQMLRLADDEKPTFPKLMTRLCERPDGRRTLLEKFRARLAYIQGFPELHRSATRFHSELATLYQVDTYITTNWDDYFEQECGATPFVTASDFAFWNVKGRKVFKLHGSVSNFGSIVATEDDYRKAHRQLQRGAIGAALKLLLATKTIVYIGYSFSDPDFIDIHRYISGELGNVARASYIVSLDSSAESRFRALGLTPIFSEASYFVRILKQHLESDGHLLPDSRFEAIPLALEATLAEHAKLHRTFSMTRNPTAIYCAAYQDGLIHSFERILARMNTGEYSHKCHTANLLKKYESIRSQRKRACSYIDVAYIEGYMNGFFYLVADDDTRKHLPRYFVYGATRQPNSITEYKRVLKVWARRNRNVARFAERIVREKLGQGDELHHTPFLTWNADAT